MVKFDMGNTDPAIPYVDDNGEYFDFHSIRHMCASLLGMNPDTPEAVRQQAMRHKSPEITRHYTKTFEDQHRNAIQALPDLTQLSREAQLAVRTGADNEILLDSCVEGAKVRSDMGACGNQSLDNVQETALGVNNGGTKRIQFPMSIFLRLTTPVFLQTAENSGIL